MIITAVGLRWPEQRGQASHSGRHKAAAGVFFVFKDEIAFGFDASFQVCCGLHLFISAAVKLLTPVQDCAAQ